jgi:hypothetical protein
MMMLNDVNCLFPVFGLVNIYIILTHIHVIVTDSSTGSFQMDRPHMTIVFKYSQPKQQQSQTRWPVPNEDPVSAKPMPHIYDVRFPNWTKQYSSNQTNENLIKNLIKRVQGSYRDTQLLPFDIFKPSLSEQYVSRNGLDSIEYTLPFTVVDV